MKIKKDDIVIICAYALIDEKKAKKFTPTIVNLCDDKKSMDKEC